MIDETLAQNLKAVTHSTEAPDRRTHSVERPARRINIWWQTPCVWIGETIICPTLSTCTPCRTALDCNGIDPGQIAVPLRAQPFTHAVYVPRWISEQHKEVEYGPISP